MHAGSEEHGPWRPYKKIMPRVRASHTHTHTAWSTTLHERVAGSLRSRARTRVPRPRLRARAGKPASWPAISVLITADVAASTRGLINYSYSAWGISASDKQSAACLFALHHTLCG